MNKQKSIFAKYYEERENTKTIEKPYGFITYKYGPDYVYITDLYILPDFRKTGHASALADKVVQEALRAGKTKAHGTVDLSANGKTQSALALLHYGFELESSDGQMIYFTKLLSKEK